MSVYAPAVGYLWELIRSYGVHPGPVFERAGVDPAARFDLQGRVSREAMNALHAEAWAATGDVAIGLRAANTFHPSYMGALGYAWLASSTLRRALEKIRRYSRLESESFRLAVFDEPFGARVVFDWEGDWKPIPPQIYAVSSLLVHLVRLLTGPESNPSRMTFSSPAPEKLDNFEAMFRCELAFEASENGLLLPRTLLERPLPSAHPELEQASDEIVVRYLAQRERGDLISQVRALLYETLPEGGVSAEIVAERLNVSPRTLRRKLDAEDISFRELLSEVRHELALRYIRDQSLTLTEISYLLGFSEPSSFSRAYRNWTGKSPSEARESQAAA